MNGDGKSNFEKNKGFWLNALFYLIVLQGSIFTFAWSGNVERIDSINGLKILQIEYFMENQIPIDENGNPTGNAVLTPAQLNIKQYYDEKIEDASKNDSDRLLYSLVLFMVLINLIFTTILGGKFLKNIRNYEIDTEKKMRRYFGAAGLLTALTIFLAVLHSVLSIFYDGKLIAAYTLFTFFIVAVVIIVIIETKKHEK